MRIGAGGVEPADSASDVDAHQLPRRLGGEGPYATVATVAQVMRPNGASTLRRMPPRGALGRDQAPPRSTQRGVETLRPGRCLASVRVRARKVRRLRAAFGLVADLRERWNLNPPPLGISSYCVASETPAADPMSNSRGSVPSALACARGARERQSGRSRRRVLDVVRCAAPLAAGHPPLPAAR
jgi:hypothetical protein